MTETRVVAGAGGVAAEARRLDGLGFRIAAVVPTGTRLEGWRSALGEGEPLFLVVGQRDDPRPVQSPEDTP